MSITYPKRLIEVDLPIRRISAHARREKSIRHGHISTLHIWWARRPLAACRAVICAALWPDPVDEHCPKSFIKLARAAMQSWTTHERQNLLSAESRERFESARKNADLFADTTELRYALLDFIADFANWDSSTVPEFLATSRELTEAAHVALGGAPGTRPLVVDPFAGGGSIPLEALRVGADAFASDLNPVPVLLNKVVLEYIPKYGQRLADEVRKWGEWIKREAEKELAEFYPKDADLPAPRAGTFWVYVLKCNDDSFYIGQTDNIPRRFEEHDAGEVSWTKSHLPVEPIHWESFKTREEAVKREKELKTGFGRKWLKREYEAGRLAARQAGGATPIAYLWARTIQCEGPGCGAEVPLMRSLWIAKKSNRATALQLVPNKKAKRVDFKIIVKQRGGWVNQDEQDEKFADPNFDGTVKRGSATCPCCGYTTPVARVREQLKARHGGSEDARMFCVVIKRVGDVGRTYRLPSNHDLKAARAAQKELEQRKLAHKHELSLVPDESLDLRGIRHTWAMIYGLKTWGSYFTPRQALTLSTLVRLAKDASQQASTTADKQFATAVCTCLAIAVGRQTDRFSSLVRWASNRAQITNTFGRQALPMMWDFAEAGILDEDAAGNFGVTAHTVVEALEKLNVQAEGGHVEQASATEHPLPSDSAQALVTDPPYYDAVPYAFLSDFFHVWFRRMLRDAHPELFTIAAVPKDQEIVVDRTHELSNTTHDIAYYERELAKAFGEGRRVVRPDGIGVIVFASKTTASWEAILKAVVDAGWIITGSWPIDTEMETRIAAAGQARLASSVHLVCRPRENPDGSVRTDEIGDWRDVLQALPIRIHEWMPRLAEEGVVGADAIFACLGPALEIFSRYSRVEKASGETVTLKEYLEQVWAAVAKEALALVFKDADTTAFEADARLTAMWLWTLKADSGTDVSSDEDDDDDDEIGNRKSKIGNAGGFTLEYDAARKIAQGLGANLENLAALVEVSSETARLLPVAERAQYLFGKEDATLAGAGAKKKKHDPQLDMFKVLGDAAEAETTFGETKVSRVGETALDRVHQTMILFAAGRSEALKRFLVDDGIGADARFWSLAQALSALYPSSTEEKRWVDGVLARKKGLGF